MTTLRYAGMDVILGRLETVRGRHLVVRAVQAAAGLTSVVLASLVVITAACGYWPDQPPGLLRWVVLAATLAAWLAAVVWLVILPVRRRLNYAQAARLVEQAEDGLHNSLINAVQLSDDDAQSPALVQYAIVEAAWRTEHRTLAKAVSLRPLRRWAIAAGAALAAVIFLAIFQGNNLRRGLSAVFRPTGYVPRVNSLKLLSLTPGDATRFVGEPLTVSATIENPAGRRYGADVVIVDGAARAMLPSANRATYSCPLGTMEQSFQYCVRIGDSKFPADKPYYTVNVLRGVEVEGLDLAYNYPAYTHLQDKTVTKAAGAVEAPLGSVVRVTLRLSGPAPAAAIQRKGGEKPPMRADADGKTFVGSLNVDGDGGYRLLLADSAGRTLQQLPDVGSSGGGADNMYPIRAIPDEPPKVFFVDPKADSYMAPGSKFTVRLKAGDDYGLGGVKLYLGRENEPEKAVRDFAEVRGKPSAEMEYPAQIGPELREGDTLVLYAVADDERMSQLGGPQRTKTPRLKIKVASAASIEAGKSRRYDQLQARLMAMLEAQEKLRVKTALAAGKATGAAGVRNLGKELAGGQAALRKDMLDVVEHFPFDAEMTAIKTALAELAGNQAAGAVTQAETLAGLAEMSARGGACAALAASQDQIIQALQWMLAIMPSLARPDVAAKTSAGEDLPSETREKLRQFKESMEKFAQEQRKVINASENLAKRPADNFSPEDEKLLKDLQAVQDKWEKFLNEQFSDFSKLGQQDFSNPALLQELLSVKTDVTMAKDALSQKAAEVATALEDNGYSNAKSLTQNLEKWLNEGTDRTAWKMEEITGQDNPEMPELPKELEDLVGELMEKEEDLFEEVEDASSKYAFAADKGIGWDAADGPMANMSAQGVTGNQLPNSNEMSGRSGEGRQGKSTGELVGDTAVGKGGRRTPTRLTPEPFQQGQIKDTSAEPAGGSTGGGKISGAGQEGLEGPLPPPLKDQLKRTAGKHAQLLNRAERFAGGMKVSDYSNYKFLQAIMLMNRIQDDLEHYRYTNVLREKGVLLSALKQAAPAGGEIEVTAEAAEAMPKKVRDDIADAMKGKLPPEYRDALQRYFIRLSETGDATQPAEK